VFIINDGNGNREAVPSTPPPKKVEAPKEPPKEAPKQGQ
jgi:hypothetical protein